MRYLKAHLEEIVIIAMLVVCLAIIGLIAFSCVESDKKNEAQRVVFMLDCEQFKPEFECAALWRSGESQAPVPVVMPVVVGR